jgi:hypothetical protein
VIALAVVAVIAVSIPIYLVVTQSRGLVCGSADTGGNFTSLNVRSNGSIAMVLTNLSPRVLQPVLANGSTIGIAVVNWTFAHEGANASLQGYTESLQSEGITVLGFVPRSFGELDQVEEYAASGLNGIFLPASELSGGACSVSQLASAGHHLGGFVAVEDSAVPATVPRDTNLVVVAYTASEWTPAVSEALAPIGPDLGVVIENATPQETLLLMGSLHTINARYYLISSAAMGTDILPIQNQVWAHDLVYHVDCIVPFNWTASVPGTTGVAQSASNGTIFLLFENLSGAYPVVTMNFSILAVNLTWGDPIFVTPSVDVPLNETDLIENSVSLQTDSDSVSLLVVDVYAAETDTATASNLSLLTMTFDSTSGVEIYASSHDTSLTPPVPSMEAFSFGYLMGSDFRAVTPLYSPAYSAIWITTTDVFTGSTVAAVQVPFFTVTNNSTQIVDNALQAEPLGPYLEESALVVSQTSEGNSTTTSSIECVALTDAEGNVDFWMNSSAFQYYPISLFLYGGAVYQLANVNSTTFLDSYNLTTQRSATPISLGAELPPGSTLLFTSSSIIVNLGNGTFIGFTRAGLRLWQVGLPTPDLDGFAVFYAMFLPANRLLIGTTSYGVNGENATYAEELYVVDPETGQLLENYTQSSELPSTPGGPVPVSYPRLIQPVGAIGGEVEFTSELSEYYFVNLSSTGGAL